MSFTALVSRLLELDSCAISDALDSVGIDGVVDGLHVRTPGLRAAGRVRTVRLAAGKPRAAAVRHLGAQSIDTAAKGDVIVVEQKTGIDAAGWGGVLAAAAKARGVGGVIVDGPVRDVDDFAALGLAVFSRSVTPRTARGRIHEAAVDQPVACGPLVVASGDYVVADGSGVVFIPADAADEVMAAAERIVAREREMVESVQGGESAGHVMGKRYETMLGTQD